MSISSMREWLASAGVSCTIAIAASLSGTAPATAQTASPLPPTCSMATNTLYSTANTTIQGSVSFACVADLSGTGTPTLVLGQMIPGVPEDGYAYYLTNNGTIRKKVCWGSSGFISTNCPP